MLALDLHVVNWNHAGEIRRVCIQKLSNYRPGYIGSIIYTIESQYSRHRDEDSGRYLSCRHGTFRI